MTHEEKIKYRNEFAKLAEDHQAFVDKTLLSLSASGLLLTITFVHNICGEPPYTHQWTLYLSWILWGLCIFVITINSQLAVSHFASAINNIINDVSDDKILKTKWSKLIELANKITFWLFFVAAISFLTFAVSNTESEPKHTFQIIHKQTQDQTMISTYNSIPTIKTNITTGAKDD